MKLKNFWKIFFEKSHKYKYGEKSVFRKTLDHVFLNQTPFFPQANHLFNNSVINVLWAIMAGTRFSHDDKDFKLLLDVLDKTFRSGGFTNRTVLLRRLIKKQLFGIDEVPLCEKVLLEFVKVSKIDILLKIIPSSLYNRFEIAENHRGAQENSTRHTKGFHRRLPS